MFQPSLFPDYEDKDVPWKFRDMFTSVSYDQSEIIRGIILMHNDGRPIEADVTYSKGVFWRKLPEPQHKFDLFPQSDDVTQADARNVPLPDESIQSLMFDPPFKASNSTVKGIIENRFSAFASVVELWDFYREATIEHYRILKSGGLYVFKCQDITQSGKFYNTHKVVEDYAEQAGFKMIDMALVINASPIWSPNMARQRHFRKTHSYFYIFRK